MKLWFFNKGQKPGDFLTNLQKDVKYKVPKMPDIPIKIPTDINVQSVTAFLQQLMNDFKQYMVPPPGSAKPMRYPYTFTAKLAQFPFKHYYKNNWIARWYPFGVAACVPVFWYCSRMANSKENKKYWKEVRRQEKEHARHKFDYKTKIV